MVERKPTAAAIKSAITRANHRMEFDGFNVIRRQELASIVHSLNGLCHMSEVFLMLRLFYVFKV